MGGRHNRDPNARPAAAHLCQLDGLSYRGFAARAELGTLIADDLAVLVSERFDLGAEPREIRAPSHPLPSPVFAYLAGTRKSIVRDLSTGGDARLITLGGPGGIGKTRSAIGVGSGLVDKFDGVVVVALEEVSSADLVVSSITSALGVPEKPGLRPAGRDHQLTAHPEDAAHR